MSRKLFSLVPLSLVMMFVALSAGSTLHAAQAAAPILQLNPPNDDYTTFARPGNGVAVAPNATLADGGSAIQSVTATISAGDNGDTLSADLANLGLQQSYDPNTRTLTITPDADNNTPDPDTAKFQQALRNIVYTPAGASTGAQRTINLTANNADGSDTDTTTVIFDRENTILDLNGTGNNPSSAGTGYSGTFTKGVTGQDPADIVDNDTQAPNDSDIAFLSDPDGFLEKVTITIDPNTRPDGALEQLFADPSGQVEVIGNGTGTLILQPANGETTAPVNDFLNALLTARYDNNAPLPTEGNRTINVVADGGATTTAAVSTIFVDQTNDAPVLDLNSSTGGINNTAEFTEQGSAGIANGGTITDPENQFITSMRVNLDGRVDHGKRNDADQTNNAIEQLAIFSNGFNVAASGTSNNTTGDYNGTVTVTNQSTQRSTTYTASYNATTGVLVISGNGPAADYQDILNQINYLNSSDDPTESERLVTVQVFDAEKGSTAAQTTISVEKVNDAATIESTQFPTTVPAGPGHTGEFTIVIADVDDETNDDPAVANQTVDYNRLPASDPNADPEKYIEITLAVTHGIISLDNTEGSVANLRFTSGSDNSSNMKFLGREEDINNVLSGFVFTSDASYTKSALLTFSVDDGTNTDDNDPIDPVILIDINSTDPVGGEPFISLDGEANTDDKGFATENTDYTTSFVVGQGEVKVTDSDAFLSDVDNNINKVTITLTDPSTDANEATAENLNAAAYDASKVIVSYNPDTKVLTLTKTANGTETDLENVLRTVTYNNASPDPSGTGRHISFQVEDSAGNSNSAVTTIDFDQGGPSLDLDADDSSGATDGDYTRTYVPGGPAVNVTDSDVAVTDPDDVINSATAKIRTLANQGDEFLLIDTSGTNISQSYSAVTGTLTLTGVDSAANYTKALQTLRYSNVSPNPTTDARFIDITVRDDANSDTATSTLTTANAPPPSNSFIDLDGSNGTTDLDGDGETDDYRNKWDQTVGAETLITDTDAFVDESDNSIQKITVTIADMDANDGIDGSLRNGVSEVLDADTTIDGVDTGITKSYDQDTGVLTLTGPGSENAFNSVLRTVRYINNSANPIGTAREFRFDVFGDADNAPDATAYTRITTTTTPGGGNDDDFDGDGIPDVDDPDDDNDGIPDVDDPDDNTPLPSSSVIDLNGNGNGKNYVAAWTQAGITRLADTDATITDTDGTVQSLTVTITNLQDGDSEVLDANVTGTNITKEYAGGVLTLTGPDTAVNFQKALRTVTYTNSGTEETTEGDDDDAETTTLIHGTTRTFEFFLDGGNGQTDTATTTINANGNLGIFTLDETVNPDGSVTLTYRITNESSQTYTAVFVRGTIAPTGDAEPGVAVSKGTVTVRWLTPRALERVFHPELGGKSVQWRVGTIAPNSEATLTITIPAGSVRSKGMTGVFVAQFGAGGPEDQTIGGKEPKAPQAVQQ